MYIMFTARDLHNMRTVELAFGPQDRTCNRALFKQGIASCCAAFQHDLPFPLNNFWKAGTRLCIVCASCIDACVREAGQEQQGGETW